MLLNDDLSRNVLKYQRKVPSAGFTLSKKVQGSIPGQDFSVDSSHRPQTCKFGELVTKLPVDVPVSVSGCPGCPLPLAHCQLE